MSEYPQTGRYENVTHKHINEFLYSKIPPLYPEIEEYAHKHGVPIASREIAGLLRMLVAAFHPENVLEIGAAIGYSTKILEERGAKVVSIERDEVWAIVARGNCKAKIIVDDAIDALPILADSGRKFDFIFMDAAKSRYIDFLPYCMKMLSDGGVMVCDNVLYRGMVATDKLRVRRKATIIRQLRVFLDEITTRDDLVTSILPIGDGVSISVKG